MSHQISLIHYNDQVEIKAHDLTIIVNGPTHEVESSGLEEVIVEVSLGDRTLGTLRFPSDKSQ